LQDFKELTTKGDIKMITRDNMKTMLGVEFDYIDRNGSITKAFVKVVDPQKGISLFSLSDRTEDGFCPRDEGFKTEQDGTWCLASLDFSVERELEIALMDLNEINSTGKLAPFKRVESDYDGSNNINCIFS